MPNTSHERNVLHCLGTQAADLGLDPLPKNVLLSRLYLGAEEDSPELYIAGSRETPAGERSKALVVTNVPPAGEGAKRILGGIEQCDFAVLYAIGSRATKWFQLLYVEEERPGEIRFGKTPCVVPQVEI